MFLKILNHYLRTIHDGVNLPSEITCLQILSLDSRNPLPDWYFWIWHQVFRKCVISENSKKILHCYENNLILHILSTFNSDSANNISYWNYTKKVDIITSIYYNKSISVKMDDNKKYEGESIWILLKPMKNLLI